MAFLARGSREGGFTVITLTVYFG